MAKSIASKKVAIITRTKNRPQFLRRAIESVRNQTYKNYVHIILNDGGDRASTEAVLEELPDAKRLVIHNENSVGLAAALNQAIRASEGEYVCILDDDDAWHVDRLSIGVESMMEMGSRANIIPMEIVIEDIDKSGAPVEVDRMPHPESWCGEVSLYKQAHRNYLSNGAVMYERSLYEELIGYDETLPTAEDWDFGIRMILVTDVEQVISNDALMYYNQRPAVKDESLGNSVHAGVREQERAVMKLRNKYLREDIRRGTIGVGFIMNDVENSLINVERIEGHINKAEDSLRAGIIESVERASFFRTLQKRTRQK